jgi:hypothetical protein
MGYVYKLDSNKTLHVIHEDTGIVLTSIYKDGIGGKREPSYGKFYFEAAGVLGDLLPGKSAVFFYLLTLAGRNGEIVLRRDQRDKIAKKTNLNIKTVYNYISELMRDEILWKMPGETAPIYWVNPKYFAIGSWDDIKERMALFEISKQLNQGARRRGADDTGGVGGDGPDDVLPVEPCEGQA